MYLSTGKVGSSKRKGRNASNRWAADTLVAIVRKRRERLEMAILQARRDALAGRLRNLGVRDAHA